MKTNKNSENSYFARFQESSKKDYHVFRQPSIIYYELLGRPCAFAKIPKNRMLTRECYRPH